MKTKLSLTVAFALAGMLAACAETKSSTGTASQAGVNVKINPNALARAQQAPPAGAASTKSAGHGNLTVNTANSPTDSDPTWIESLDIDMDGKADSAEYTYDDDDKVTYIYSEVTFPCVTGDGIFKGGMLTAVYGLNNTWGKAPGSGWYVSELNAGQCGAQAKALWGCRFNAVGERQECGWVTIQAEKDDIVITAGEVAR
ncbi:MAG TPA: hypothetical protein VEJ89_09095 [Myxococcaceae bacterium]|nr:hypothetical protein [Myxococcaceae bacterium]